MHLLQLQALCHILEPAEVAPLWSRQITTIFLFEFGNFFCVVVFRLLSTNVGFSFFRGGGSHDSFTMTGHLPHSKTHLAISYFEGAQIMRPCLPANSCCSHFFIFSFHSWSNLNWNLPQLLTSLSLLRTTC